MDRKPIRSDAYRKPLRYGSLQTVRRSETDRKQLRSDTFWKPPRCGVPLLVLLAGCSSPLLAKATSGRRPQEATSVRPPETMSVLLVPLAG